MPFIVYPVKLGRWHVNSILKPRFHNQQCIVLTLANIAIFAIRINVLQRNMMRNEITVPVMVQRFPVIDK